MISVVVQESKKRVAQRIKVLAALTEAEPGQRVWTHALGWNHKGKHWWK